MKAIIYKDSSGMQYIKYTDNTAAEYLKLFLEEDQVEGYTVLSTDGLLSTQEWMSDVVAADPQSKLQDTISGIYNDLENRILLSKEDLALLVARLEEVLKKGSEERYRTLFERALAIMKKAEDTFFKEPYGDGGIDCANILSAGRKELSKEVAK